ACTGTQERGSRSCPAPRAASCWRLQSESCTNRMTAHPPPISSGNSTTALASQMSRSLARSAMVLAAAASASSVSQPQERQMLSPSTSQTMPRTTLVIGPRRRKRAENCMHSFLLLQLLLSPLHTPSISQFVGVPERASPARDQARPRTTKGGSVSQLGWQGGRWRTARAHTRVASVVVIALHVEWRRLAALRRQISGTQTKVV